MRLARECVLCKKLCRIVGFGRMEPETPTLHLLTFCFRMWWIRFESVKEDLFKGHIFCTVSLQLVLEFRCNNNISCLLVCCEGASRHKEQVMIQHLRRVTISVEKFLLRVSFWWTLWRMLARWSRPPISNHCYDICPLPWGFSSLIDSWSQSVGLWFCTTCWCLMNECL